MRKLYFSFIVNVLQILKSLQYTYDQKNCINYTKGPISVAVINTHRCQIKFTFKGTNQDDLILKNVYIVDFSTRNTLKSIHIEDSTLLTCSINFTEQISLQNVSLFQGDVCNQSLMSLSGVKISFNQVNIYGDFIYMTNYKSLQAVDTNLYICQLKVEQMDIIYFHNVTITNLKQCSISSIEFKDNLNLTLQYVNIKNMTVDQEDYAILLASDMINLSNVRISDNFCHTSRLLSLINFYDLTMENITFDKNILMKRQSSLISISNTRLKYRKYHVAVENLLYMRNTLAGTFFQIIANGIHAKTVNLNKFTFKQNVVETFFLNLAFYNPNKTFDNSDVLAIINLVQINCLSQFSLTNTQFSENTIMLQNSVRILLSEGSAPNIVNFTIQNNTFQCLQLTMFYFSEDFGNNLQKVTYGKSNSRNPEVIFKLSQTFLNNLTLYKTDFTTYDTLYSQSCSIVKNMYSNQYSMTGIISSESQYLNCFQFHVQLDDLTVFQILQSLNLVSVLSANVKDISISRQTYRQDIFDAGMFQIDGQYSRFALQKIHFMNLRFGKGSAFTIQQLSSQHSSAQFALIISDITIYNCQTYILDNSKQYALFAISNNMKQIISLESFKITNFTLFSYPQFYSHFDSKSVRQCINFDINPRINYFSNHTNQIISLTDQSALIYIQSLYANVVLQNMNFQNLSTQYVRYGIYIVAENIQIKHLICNVHVLSQQQINLIYQSFMTFFASNVLVQNIKISNQTSMQNQILSMYVIGKSSLISLKDIYFYAIQTDGALDDYDRPTIQIQSTTTYDLKIKIDGLHYNIIKNLNLGGLLQIISLGKSRTKVHLNNIVFNQIFIQQDTVMMYLDLASSDKSDTIVGNLSFNDLYKKSQNELNLIQYFSFLDIKSIKSLRINNISISTYKLKQALQTQNVSEIIVQNFLIFNTNTKGNLFKIKDFIFVSFNKMIFKALNSQDIQTGYLIFKNRNQTLHQKLQLQRIFITKTSSPVCCHNFFEIRNVNLQVYKLIVSSNQYLTLFHLDNSKIQIDQSFFTFNQLKKISLNQNYQNGSIIYAHLSQVLVSRSIFFQINGSYAGGAIYFFVDTPNLQGREYNLYFSKDVYFAQCSAQYGGAIYHRSLNPSTNFQNIFWQNNKDYKDQFNNIASIPDSIYLLLYENQQDQDPIVKFSGVINRSQGVQLLDIKSGSYLNLSLQLREKQSIHYDQMEQHMEGWGQFVFDTGSYKLPQLQVKNQTNSQTLFIKIKNTIKHKYQLVDIKIQFHLHFRPCVPGEFMTFGFQYQQERLVNNTNCKFCPQNTYNLANNSLICLDCPHQSNCLGGILYELSNGWWRQNFSSNELTKCEENTCVESRTDQTQCSYGFIGPLCQQCDAKGSFWKYNFSRSPGNKCQKCSENIFSLLLYLVLGILVILSIELQLMLTYGSNILGCLVRYIRILGILPLGTSGLFNASVYIKTLVFHFQVLSMLEKLLRNDLWSQIIQKQDVVGNQSKIFIFAYDCVYGKYEFAIPSLAYMDVILAWFYQIIIMIIGLLFSLIHIDKKKDHYRPNYGSFVVLYSYWIQIPQIAFYIGAAISCRQIFLLELVKSDLTQSCTGKNHWLFLSFLLIPTLIFQLCSGMFALYQLRKNKSRLHLIKIHSLYGMLFQEYKIQYSSHEIIKLYVKLTVVFLINLLDDLVMMALVINLVLLAYFCFTQKQKPYIYHLAQKIDQFEIIILITTIQLMTVSQYSTQQSVQTILFIITFMANLLLTLTIIPKLFESYTQKFDIRKLYDRYIINTPFLKRIFYKPRIHNLTVFQNWKFVRTHVLNKTLQLSNIAQDTLIEETIKYYGTLYEYRMYQLSQIAKDVKKNDIHR